MSILSWLTGQTDPAAEAERAAAAERQAEILLSVQSERVPASARRRFEGIHAGTLPWIATLTPAELLIARTHGVRPIAAVSATCWLHYGWSWTEGHSQGWEKALQRLGAEAKAAGANAVLDVKMRTIPLSIENSMDFTLIGTAVKIDGMAPSKAPIIATLPALEFIKLLESDVVPAGIAIGAEYDWLNDPQGTASRTFMGNIEATRLSQFWEKVRHRAHAQLRASAKRSGNGVLAHTHFSQLFKVEGDDSQPTRYLGRHIVIATTLDARRSVPFSHGIKMVVDMRDGPTPLVGTEPHHQSYQSNDAEGAI